MKLVCHVPLIPESLGVLFNLSKKKKKVKIFLLWLVCPNDLHRVESSSLDERGHPVYAVIHLILLSLKIFTEYLPFNSC